MTVDFRSSFWQIHHVNNVHLLEDKIQDWGMHLLTISYGSYVMDQRSGDGWISGWSKIFVFCKVNSWSKLWVARRQNCFSTEQNHPEYPLQEKVSVEEMKSSQRRPFPSRKADRLHGLPILPGHWGQRFCRGLCRPIYNCSSKWWYSGIRLEMGRNSIVNDENPIWWHLGRIVQIQNTRVWETDLIITDWRQWWKEASSRIYELRNFEARNGNYERNAVIKNQGTKQREQRSLGDCWQWKANGQCCKGEKQPNPSPSSSTRQNERNASRTRSLGGRSPGVKMARLPCKDYLKGTCTNSLCEKWHPPECLFYKSENGCRFGEKCSYAHRQFEEQPGKRSKKNCDRSAVAMLKITRQLGCVLQDMEPPKSSSISRKSSNRRKPIRFVKFTKAVVRHVWHSRPKSIAWNDLPRWSSSA